MAGLLVALLLAIIGFFSTRSPDGFIKGIIYTLSPPRASDNVQPDEIWPYAKRSEAEAEAAANPAFLPPLPEDQRPFWGHGGNLDDDAPGGIAFNGEHIPPTTDRNPNNRNAPVLKRSVLSWKSMPISGTQAIFDSMDRVEQEHLQYRNLQLVRDERCLPFVERVFSAAVPPEHPKSDNEQYTNVEAALIAGYSAECFIPKKPVVMSPEFEEYWHNGLLRVKPGAACSHYIQRVSAAAFGQSSEPEKRDALAAIFESASRDACLIMPMGMR